MMLQPNVFFNILNMRLFLIAILVGLFSRNVEAQENLNNSIKREVNKSIPYYIDLYKYLHQNPELSLQEFKTALRMQNELSALGFEVTPAVGGNSVVGVYKNDNGPVIMMRADMDALPILEKTELPYASTIVMKNKAGENVPVMHACGHDMHMSVFLATANGLVKLKDKWKGTIVFIAQQAEEGSNGAEEMINDGLFHKFPKPEYILAYHVSPSLPAGTVGYRSGAFMASVTNLDILFKGVGGHGAYPEKSIDPIVLASRAILDYQTIISREILPIEPAVLTVGSIHGGTQYNIIPDEVKLQITIRTYSIEVRNQIVESVKRISKYVALSAKIPEDKLPVVTIQKQSTLPVINNDALVNKATTSIRKILGNENVTEELPSMGGEDFGRYGLTDEKIPISMFRLGSVNLNSFNESIQKGIDLPSLHSPYYYPDPEVTLRTGSTAMIRTIIDLLNENK